MLLNIYKKCQNRPKMSKKVQKRHSGAKALLLETLFVYPFLMMSGCQNKVEIREILNIIIFKRLWTFAMELSMPNSIKQKTC